MKTTRKADKEGHYGRLFLYVYIEVLARKLRIRFSGISIRHSTWIDKKGYLF